MSETERDLEQERIRGADAQQLLRNTILSSAFERVAAHMEQRALSASDTDPETCSKIIQGKQILAGVRREIYKIVQEGEAARIRLDEIERRKGFPKFRR